MKHIVLAGDSIFDNAGYVDKDDAVIDQTSAKLSGSDKASLIAVDGDITADVLTQEFLFRFGFHFNQNFI